MKFMISPFVLLLLLSQVSLNVSQIASHSKGKICIGTNGRMSFPSNREHHYRNLRDRYVNCTYVDGNLELTWLQDDKLNLSFLHHIREVTGYVFISHVDVRRVSLPSLQIIRGRSLFDISSQTSTGSYALLVTHCKMHSLEMPALRDILRGSVSLVDNYNLCHVRSVNWTEIMSDEQSRYSYTYNFSHPQRSCHCHDSCERGCWGEGEHNCQKFSKITCMPQCHPGRCYGPGPRDCCNEDCAGGCTGPTTRDCLACKNFNDDGQCKKACEIIKKYNHKTYSWDVDPNGKYAYGATCVRECPGHLLKDSGACVRSCPRDKKAENGECVPCVGPCPKTCKGVKEIHSGNIDMFKDCTIIEGSLTILDQSFDGFQHVYDNFTFGPKFSKMHPSKLEVFHTLKEVTGYISVQATHPHFTSLSFLRNLEVIGGREQTDFFSSLHIIKTTLKSLGFKSLKKIRGGSVAILENKNLCFVDSINWRKLMPEHSQELRLKNNKGDDFCRADGNVCHLECSQDGCWEHGQDQCFSCRNKKLDDRCINNCRVTGIYEKNDKECGHCHSECVDGCFGSNSSECVRCKNVRDGPYCVESCPTGKFNSNGICKLCHKNCVDGCKGAENNVGDDGCYSCKKALVNDNNEVEYCLASEEKCPNGYFSEWIVRQEAGLLSSMAGNEACRKCHPMCKNCTAYGIHVSVCHECQKYRKGENCEDKCPHDHYVYEEKTECLKCSTECSDRCRGPLSTDCMACRNYRIYLKGEPSGNNTDFNCTATCPEDHPYKLFPVDFSDPYCAAEQIPLTFDEESIPAIVGGTLGCVFVLCMFLSVICYLWWQRNRSKEEALKMTMTMMPYDDSEPLKPTNIKPDLTRVRLVTEAELRRGGLMGVGAFGAVFKGVWIPEGENVKIPVAIKVVRERDPNDMSEEAKARRAKANTEFIQEARVMASVDHPNLLQLLAFCVTTQTMLVSQLMPLGCLLDYVQNNKDKVGSKALLNWCTQIAKGMAFLEERKLVHRDLAARNVLVQTPNNVKITDFGLAKLLDYEEEYKAAGGLMPIKWLALECIQYRIFSCKSDVWAFGVTIWEILTYGSRPYEDISVKEVPAFLEKGERLPQPSICTIDIYMLMIRCWMLDADSRPSFHELAEEFAKTSRDPGRYLVIPGDKLMRLPSYTPQDERELIRSLSSAIGGEEILVPAQEYFHPSSNLGHPPPISNSSHSEPATPIKTNANFPEFRNNHAESPQNRQNLRREQQNQYSQLDGILEPRPRNGDRLKSAPSRQSTHQENMEVGDNDCFMTESMTSDAVAPPFFDEARSGRPVYGWVGNMRLELPLDDDDYLMPSPHDAGQPTVGPSHQNYLELVNNDDRCNKGVNSKYARRGNLPHANRGNGTAQNSCFGMDNPEYHLSAVQARHKGLYLDRFRERSSPIQQVGVPVLNPNRFQKHSTSSCSSGQSSGGPTFGAIPQNNHNHAGFSGRPSESRQYYNNEVTRIPSTPRPETAV